MQQLLRHKIGWLTRVLLILVGLFVFQVGFDFSFSNGLRSTGFLEEKSIFSSRAVDIGNRVNEQSFKEKARVSASFFEGVSVVAAKESIQLTKARFGHSFVKHGEDATTFLINRAKGSGQVQGQFLNNQKAAQFILDNVGKTVRGAINVLIPKGFPVRVIMPNDTFRTATHIRLVLGGNGVKTAYPLIPGL